MFTLVVPPESPCGCGSGRAFGSCCLRDGKIVLSPKDIHPPGSATGESIRGCFLADHHNCGECLSGDHVISAVVLRQITTDKITIIGPNHQRSVYVKDNSLKVRCLCRRHNSALSPLDTEAGRLFAAVQSVEDTLSQGIAPEQRLYLFEGFDIERWLLKTLIAAYYGKVSDVRPQTHTLPDNLALAFDYLLSPPFGLYVPTLTSDGGQHTMTLARNAMLSLITYRSQVVGVAVSLSGLTFKLLLNGPSELVDQFALQHVYRPKFINFFRGTDVVSIAITHIESSEEMVWIASGDPNAEPPHDE
jgi:hypothetical protein